MKGFIRFATVLVAATGAGCISSEPRPIDETAVDLDAAVEIDAAAEVHEVESDVVEETVDVAAETRDVAEETRDIEATEVDTHIEVETEVDAHIGEVTRTGETVVPPECDQNSDCLEALPPCHVWQCVDTRCEAVIVSGGSCDDDNVCSSESGTCIDGWCVATVDADCETDRVCHRPTCDARSGCGAEPALNGVCNLDTGFLWGSCAGKYMAPVDECSSSGVCLDTAAQTSLPLQEAALTGEWFMAVQGLTATNRGSTAGLVTFGADGKWGGTLRTLTAPFVVQDPTARGWCMDSRLGLGFDFGPNHFVGQVSASGEALIASGKLANEVAIGLRPHRVLVDVDGTYVAMMSGVDSGALAIPVTMTAALSFSRGCLDEGSVLHSKGSATFIVDNKVCLSMPPDGIVALTLATEEQDGTIGQLPLRGAIGARGDALLFVRESGAGNPLVFGTALMVRTSPSVAAAFVGTTRWTFAMQESTVDGSLYLGFPGTFVMNDASIVNGTLLTVPINVGRFDFDPYGRFLASLGSPTVDRRLGGHLSPTLGLGFLYEQTVPADWVTLFDISDDARWPSFGVIVRRL